MAAFDKEVLSPIVGMTYKEAISFLDDRGIPYIGKTYEKYDEVYHELFIGQRGYWNNTCIAVDFNNNSITNFYDLCWDSLENT